MPGGSASAGAPAASARPAEPSRCRPLTSYALALQAPPLPAAAKQLAPAEEAEEDPLLPFGVDVGQAVPTSYGFAVAGLRGAGQAFAAILSERASRTVELGVLHGDAETPTIAAAGERVVVALRGSDAAGFTLKVGQIQGPNGSVEWGYEHAKLGKEVTGVALALAGENAVVVYQGEDRRGPRLFAGSFHLAQLKAPFELEMLEPKDAESPHLVARPGGFWLSWVRTVDDKPAKKADAAPSDPEASELLQVGLRVIEVAQLDQRGKLLGPPVRVGEPRREMLLFDAALAASGSLLIARRSDSSTPGAEGGGMILSEVGADGSVHEERLEDDEMGAGAPVLLADSNAPVPEPWLAVSSPTDATRLGRARGRSTVLAQDALLGRAEVLAMRAGHFLTQRPRGRGAELEVLACSLEPPQAPPAK